MGPFGNNAILRFRLLYYFEDRVCPFRFSLMFASICCHISNRYSCQYITDSGMNDHWLVILHTLDYLIFGSFSRCETTETIRCDKTAHRHTLWRRFTNIIYWRKSADSKVTNSVSSSSKIYLSGTNLRWPLIGLNLFRQRRTQVKMAWIRQYEESLWRWQNTCNVLKDLAKTSCVHKISSV